MEYAIAIFVGLWIMASGLLAYFRIKKDFSKVEDETKNEEKDGAAE